MRLPYFFSGLLCFFGPLAFLAAQMNKIGFEKYTLGNGLTVILHEDHSTPIVAVTVLYHVGSKNESPERTGFAHFFEHLMFEGSKNIGRGEYVEYVENAGGSRNAYTTQDRTLYYEELPSNQLELGLWLESERMLHATVDKKGIETQREVVKEERRQRVDNQPYGSLQEEAMRRAYKQHPYRWTPIGSMAHLDAATEADYVNFYKTFYVPNNAVLSIAGDINVEQTKKLVEKYFGSIPRGKNKIPRPSIKEPPLNGQVRDTVRDNIQLPAVVQVYRIPAQGTEDFYAVDMFTRLMAAGQSSRLYKSLVDQQQKAVATGNFPFQLEDPGVSIAFGVANMGVDSKDLEAAMDEEFQKAQAQLISEQEFQKLRNQVEDAFVSQNTDMLGLAQNLAIYETHFGDANLINTELQRYMAVTREDILRVARTYFSKDKRVVLFYLPRNTQP